MSGRADGGLLGRCLGTPMDSTMWTCLTVSRRCLRPSSSSALSPALPGSWRTYVGTVRVLACEVVGDGLGLLACLLTWLFVALHSDALPRLSSLSPTPGSRCRSSSRPWRASQQRWLWTTSSSTRAKRLAQPVYLWGTCPLLALSRDGCHRVCMCARVIYLIVIPLAE